ncbi:hydroxymethylglutaryl-CoA lyase [Paraburkholderia sp. D15]|uniref:hydroxymethylglutaryl-CoA lyase n=1 Tax=Paraburkholderia sp. D15 TaxID=2880218 RepID=UPI002478E41B|nr:hydroxymethylglutaryl-CoA lyase [Paraburkholderia sp. D15]WGS50556.1 hydroxymethylglutaryl-CoA lyase [Paraburkholderia sp. D15]
MSDTQERVVVTEVGLRDGLQSIARIMPTEFKRRWIDAAYAAGVRHMEVASFVPAKWLPQMADADAVIAHALTYDDLIVTALVPNLKGAQRALEAGVHRIVAPISVSAAHSLANVRKTPGEMIDAFAAMRELIDSAGRGVEAVAGAGVGAGAGGDASRDADRGASSGAAAGAGTRGRRVELIAGLSTVFGCTLQGAVPSTDVAAIARAAVAAGADVIALGDTTGEATPRQVGEIIEVVRGAAGDRLRSLHFHDTRGLGLANTLIALQHGIREFDASLAGLGGCPHAPGATGNVNTEDLVFMLDSMGYDTGIDIARLLASRAVLADALPGEPLYGYLARAGLPKQFTAARPRAGSSAGSSSDSPESQVLQ